MSVLNVVPVQSKSVKLLLDIRGCTLPHCSVDGDLRGSCSKCCMKLQSLDGCFPIYRGRNPCSSSDLPLVLEERAIIVRDVPSLVA